MTQGVTFEKARESLIDAIELWVLSAIKDGDDLPVVNGCKLAVPGLPEAEAVNAQDATVRQGRVGSEIEKAWF